MLHSNKNIIFRSFRLSDPTKTDIGSPAMGAGPYGPLTTEVFFEICNNFEIIYKNLFYHRMVSWVWQKFVSTNLQVGSQ